MPRAQGSRKHLARRLGSITGEEDVPRISSGAWIVGTPQSSCASVGSTAPRSAFDVWTPTKPKEEQNDAKGDEHNGCGRPGARAAAARELPFQRRHCVRPEGEEHDSAAANAKNLRVLKPAGTL